MFTYFDPSTLVYEQFRGYYQKQPINLADYEPRTSAMDVILGHDRIQQTNIVKQADVVMATYLLSQQIGREVQEANFRYYEPRTGHGSSLSPSVHALMAARLGDQDLARRYLQQAAEIDLGNNMGNAAAGVHAAALGGLWQAMVFGFAGVEFNDQALSFAPHLLPEWKRLAFSLQWRGSSLRLRIEPGSLRVGVNGNRPVRLRVAGAPPMDAAPGHEYVSEQTHTGWQSWRTAADRS
jgi:kojibiose phosphorylase